MRAGLIQSYVDRYNTVRLHSAIGYVTPQDMLAGRQAEIHAARDRKLEQARRQRQLRRQQASVLGCFARSGTSAATMKLRQVKQKRALRGLATMLRDNLAGLHRGADDRRRRELMRSVVIQNRNQPGDALGPPS